MPASLTGAPAKEPAPKPEPVAEPQAETAPEASKEAAQTGPEPKAEPKTELRGPTPDEIIADPLVRTVLDVFQGEVKRIHPRPPSKKQSEGAE